MGELHIDDPFIDKMKPESEMKPEEKKAEAEKEIAKLESQLKEREAALIKVQSKKPDHFLMQDEVVEQQQIEGMKKTLDGLYVQLRDAEHEIRDNKS